MSYQSTLLGLNIFIALREEGDMTDIVEKILDIFERAISAEIENRDFHLPLEREQIRESYRKRISKLFRGGFSQKSIVKDITDTFDSAIHCEAMKWKQVLPIANVANKEKYEKELIKIHEGALRASYTTALHCLFREEDKI